VLEQFNQRIQPRIGDAQTMIPPLDLGLQHVPVYACQHIVPLI
jgi:hypothetical protein